MIVLPFVLSAYKTGLLILFETTFLLESGFCFGGDTYKRYNSTNTTKNIWNIEDLPL